MGRALWDSGIAQWVGHYGIVDSSVGRALWDEGIVQGVIYRLSRSIFCTTPDSAQGTFRYLPTPGSVSIMKTGNHSRLVVLCGGGMEVLMTALFRLLPSTPPMIPL